MDAFSEICRRAAGIVSLLSAAALPVACSYDYGDLIFVDDAGAEAGASGADSNGGACSAPEIECASECVVPDQDTQCGGCENDCTGQGLTCSSGACGCTANSHCGRAGACNLDAGRCECSGMECQAGERCQRIAAAVVCTCNGGPACTAGERCCENPAGCRASCQL